MPYYAVAAGREPGIYTTWDECRKQVDGYKGAKQQKFATELEAKSYMMMHCLTDIGDIENMPYEVSNTNTQMSHNIPSSSNPHELLARVSLNVPTPECNRLDDGVLYIFTDGSLRNGIIGSSVVLVHNNNIISTTRLSICGDSTNSLAELRAIEEAMNLIFFNGIKSVSIYSDSQYAVDVINGVKMYYVYSSLVEGILRSLETLRHEGYTISVNWIRAHTGKDDFLSYYNSVADNEAASATELYKSNYKPFKQH